MRTSINFVNLLLDKYHFGDYSDFFCGNELGSLITIDVLEGLVLLSACERTLDLALVVDGSSIITRSDPDDWRRMITFAHDLVAKFDLGSGRTRVAAIVYGDVATVVFYLNTFNNRVSVSAIALYSSSLRTCWFELGFYKEISNYKQNCSQHHTLSTYIH